MQPPLPSHLVRGIPTLLIPSNQYRVRTAQLKLDLLDKRYPIFPETWTILSEAAMTGTKQKNYALGNPFSNYIPKAAFLFGKDVEVFLKDAVRKLTELYAIEAETDPSSLAQNAKQRADLKQWFFNEADAGAKKLF